LEEKKAVARELSKDPADAKLEKRLRRVGGKAGRGYERGK
jgi:hypothetical protein